MVEAHEHYERALKIVQTSLEPDNLKAANLMCGLAIAYKNDDNVAGAVSLLTLAANTYQKHLPVNHPDIAMCMNLLGECHLRRQDFSQAEECFQTALTIRTVALGDLNPNTASTKSNLGVF